MFYYKPLPPPPPPPTPTPAHPQPTTPPATIPVAPTHLLSRTVSHNDLDAEYDEENESLSPDSTDYFCFDPRASAREMETGICQVLEGLLRQTGVS